VRALVCLGLLVVVRPAYAQSEERSGLAIELTGPAKLYPDELTRVRATLKNTGKEPARVVIPLDGAQEGVRKVRYDWAVVANDQPLTPKVTGRGNFDPKQSPIKGGEVVVLKPGEEMPLFLPFAAGDFFDLRQPAVYEITLTYCFDPKGPKDVAQGQDGEKTLAEMESLSKVTVSSEALRIRVLPFPPQLEAADAKLKAAQARLELLRGVLKEVMDNPDAPKAEQAAAGERLERAEKAYLEVEKEFTKLLAEFDKTRPKKR
jgi:hypothetical protein